MQKLRDWYSTLSPTVRRVFVTTGVITFIFITFSLVTIKDLLAPVDLSDYFVNPVPFVISIVGIIATVLAARGKTRPASYMLMVAISVGLMIIAIYATQPIYTTVAELVIVILPIFIAIQSLPEQEFTWVVVITLLVRSIIQVVGSFKTATPVSSATAQTATIAQWTSLCVAGLFAIYIAMNLNRFSFRVKMILVLGVLTIVPTAILTSVSSSNLENNLIDQANKGLVLSSDQLASAVDLYVQTALDTTRIEAQIPALEDYVGQPSVRINGGDPIFAHGTDLENVTDSTLRAILKKDPYNILSVRLLDRQGTLQLSTDMDEVGEFHATDDFVLQPLGNGLPYMSPITIDERGRYIVHFSAPIRTTSGVNNGILDIVYSSAIFQQIVARNSDKLGADVNAMLIDEDNVVLAHTSTTSLLNKIVDPKDQNKLAELITAHRLPNLEAGQISVTMFGLVPGLQNLATSQTFTGDFIPGQYSGASTDTALDQAAASQLSSMDWHVLAFVPRTTLLAPVQQQTRGIIFISVLISLVSIGIAMGLTQVLITPILRLTRTSERITQGDMNATAVVRTQDEIGALAATFNSMTSRVRELIGGLEQRVAERTKALEKRAIQLQAAGDVGSTAARLRDMNELMRQAVRLISQRFDYYHVGIFLLDDRNEFAVLRAANSEGGQLMLSRGHKLKVGQVGIVGYVCGTGQPRIALNVGQDAEYFNNPDLPLTQSEMALPLVAGGNILGALDIQSTEAAAFTEDDVTTLKVLADQIAVAIENARLFTENQAALEAARRAYGEASARGWQSLLQGKTTELGYASFSGDRVSPVSEEAGPEIKEVLESGQPILTNNEKTLHLPITVRGHNIGTIRMDKKQNGDRWSTDDIAMAGSLAEQLGNALESARLYADISQRAEREAVISEIASKIGASIQIDTILRTSVEELGRALQDSEVIIQMGSPSKNGGSHE